MRALVVVPARGGSKGVHRKNVQLVAGLPLVVHAVRAGRTAALASVVVTTTDDPEIARLARDAGSVVVDRPDELATDDSPVLDCVLHALAEVERSQPPFDAVVLLQPTSPLRDGNDVDAAIRLLDDGAPGVISVCRTDDVHPARMYRIEDGELRALWPEWQTARRQDLPELYVRNGAIYAVRREVLLEQRTLMPDGAVPYVMPIEVFANVDDERDLAIADVLARRQLEGRG